MTAVNIGDACAAELETQNTVFFGFLLSNVFLIFNIGDRFINVFINITAIH